MYISKVTIKSYRNLRDFEIQLKPFTLIIGENNTGKTNLVNALGLIFSQEITFFKYRLLEIDDFNYDVVQRFKRRVADKSVLGKDIQFPEVSIEVILSDMDEEQEAVVGDWFCNKGLTEAKLTYLFRPRTGFKRDEWINERRSTLKSKNADDGAKEIDLPIKQYEYVIYGGDDQSNRCEPYFLRMLKMEFLDALRDAKRELVASGDYRLLFRVLNKKNHQEYGEIKEQLAQLDDHVRRNQALKGLREEIESLLARISLQEKDEYNRVDFSFTPPETTEILKKLSLIYGTDPISVDRNGLGRNNLLFISLVLSQLSGGQTGAEVTSFRLVGIEEPEAHLHPQLQDHLARNIEGLCKGRKDIQLILTSHSANMVACLNLDTSVVLYRDADGNIRNHYLLKGFGQSATEIRTVRYLEKYLDATKSRMFFARKLILVEGISEQILLPRFYEIHSKRTLEKFGCEVVNVNGVAFRHFLEIVKHGYYLKCLVLTDSDAGKTTEERAEKLRTDYETFSIIRIQVNSSTFEKEIMEANKRTSGKAMIVKALKETRPLLGRDLETRVPEEDLDVKACFELVKDCKSDFASNLLEVLHSGARGFVIPDYIREGFDFLNG